jgi:hypothetical protein
LNLIVLSEEAVDDLLPPSIGAKAGMQYGAVAVYAVAERFHGKVKVVDLVVLGEVRNGRWQCGSDHL